ncbi:MAG: histidine triad nucleotide-binding protein [Lachnospiraceae bacterium]|jgi:histidine triad (HIT) family protein|nr:histidine triad nucleotide-binding protein [Lachnospiraceae bacterium]
MEDCIFCKIINKEINSKILYEDEEIIAFNDINPIAPIHILVLPKKHISKLTDLKKEDEAVIGKIMSVINKLAKENNIAETGFRVVANCGVDGGQAVGHIHFHLLGGRKLENKM